MSGKPKSKPSASWGGPRANSGQPKKPRAAPITERPKVTGLSTQELARQHLDLAIATLAEIASSQDSATARVSACKVIIDAAKDDHAKTSDAELKPTDKWGAILDLP